MVGHQFECEADGDDDDEDESEVGAHRTRFAIRNEENVSRTR